MLKIFIPTILQIIMTYVLRIFGIQLMPEVIIIIYLFTVLFFTVGGKEFFKILVLGYLLRLFLMYFDVYFNDIFVLPHTGDAQSFYDAGTIYYNYGSLSLDGIYGGLYSKFLGFIMLLTGQNRLLLQHINIIFDMASILMFKESLNILNVKDKYVKIFVSIYTFMPMHMIIASVLMRESIIVFLISNSLLRIIEYYYYNNTRYLIGAFIFVIIASLFHSAVIFILIGYFYVILHTDNKIDLKKAINIFILLLVLTAIVYLNRDIIFRKIMKNGEINLSYGNYKGAGSLYLSKLSVNNLRDAIIYAPIRAIYFLISPTPLYWRGFIDVLSFIFDSVVYIIYVPISIRVLRDKKNGKANNFLIIGLIISILVFSIVFGLGVNNSGTAIRHRNKILMVILTIIAYFYDNKYAVPRKH